MYRELLHPVRGNLCSVLTKAINCTLQSSCWFSNNRALQNSIVRIIPINGWSPKAVVPTVVPTFSIHVHRPKSIVQAISINKQPVKTFFRTIPINSLRDHVGTIAINWKHQTSIVQAIPINRHPVKTIFRTIPIDKQCPRSFVWTIPITWKHQTSIVQSIPINRQSPKSIV